jgi:hypothetical protein
MQHHVGGIPSVQHNLWFMSLTLHMTRGMPVSDVTAYRLDDQSSVPGKANNYYNLPPLHCSRLLLRHKPQSNLTFF